jgi:Pyruvate/2-oxoacid:ferredoxin oxidoreductase delta subunit
MIADPEEAELLLALPANIPDLSEKLGRDVDSVQEAIQLLFVKGLVFPSYKTDPPTYRMGRDIIQFHDATILWPDAPKPFLDLWQEWTEIEWPDLAKVISEIMPKPSMRVIPVGVSAKADGKILAYEDVKDLIENARKLAVTKCTCRLVAHKCDRTLEACLQVNNAAAYAIARGSGREVSVEEALDIVRKAEEEGLIHTTFNQRSVDHVICNCCGCCCQFLPVQIEKGIPVADPSRFEAQVDPDICSGCETCLDRCYFDALQMVQGDEGGETMAQVDPDKCLGCGLCKVTCPEDAIAMKEIRAPDFVPESLHG